AEASPLTNRDLFTMPALPARLAVIGGGPIGLELGQALGRLGSAVTIFEAAGRIASTEEPEVSAELQRILEAEGLRVVTGAMVKRVDRTPGGSVMVETAAGPYEFDEILVAAGRIPRVPAGLDELGLERDKRGYVRISPC